MDERNISRPRLGMPAPEFEVRTTQGNLHLPNDFVGNWVVLFGYTGDFQPVTSTELLAFNELLPQLELNNAKLVAISPDTVATHIAYLRSMCNFNKEGKCLDFRLASDPDGKMSRLYGLNPFDLNSRSADKTVFIIDPAGILRAYVTYPLDIGINTQEVLRVLLALKTSESQNVQTPANWVPGAYTMVDPPQSMESANNRITSHEKLGGFCMDWYLCFRDDNGQRERSLTQLPQSDLFTPRLEEPGQQTNNNQN